MQTMHLPPTFSITKLPNLPIMLPNVYSICGEGDSGVSKFWKRGKGQLSALSSFIANAHNELYAFYTEKGGFLEKNLSQLGGAYTAPFESVTGERMGVCTFSILLF